MLVGFIHGVMNTDNMAISGETIDYGPCAFMDAFDPGTVFSSIDHMGRYAYGNQPRIAQWNLARLAETLLPLIGDDAVEQATEVLKTFDDRYGRAWRDGMRAKLGLREPDAAFFEETLELLHAERVDYTGFFRALPDAALGDPRRAHALFTDAAAFDAWADSWRPLTSSEALGAMNDVNPAYIPRNHLVEEALTAATNDDLLPLGRLMEVLARPFDEREDREPRTRSRRRSASRAPTRPSAAPRSHRNVAFARRFVATSRAKLHACPATVQFPDLARWKSEHSRGRASPRSNGEWSTSTICARAALRGREVETRVATGVLFRVYRGVYAVGHPNLSLEGRFLAAVLACGPGAALSHYCAAVLWGLRPWIERFPDVTSPTQRRQPGINHHRSEQFERTVHKGIPVVTPKQAIFDISSVVQFKSLRGAVNEALGLELVTPGELITHTGRGAKNLRRVFATAAPTKSENENLVRHLIHEAGLPTPLVNPPLRGTAYIPDFLWPDHGLILEADSKRFHGNMLARADDATRQLAARGHGLSRHPHDLGRGDHGAERRPDAHRSGAVSTSST